MKALKWGSVAAAALAASVVLMYGCGGEKITMEDAQVRIKALETKGVPDSLLSKPKVHLYQAKSSKATGNSGLARRSMDSLAITLEAAEAWYASTMEAVKPEVEKMREGMKDRVEALTGLQKKSADSMIALIDSFAGMNWMIQARQQCTSLEGMLSNLEESEKKAAGLRKKLPGTWFGQRVTTDGGKAVETRSIKFASDGAFEMSEAMKGQTSEYLKEDWQFISYGKYDVKGDTVMFFIEREKCPRQIFWSLQKGGWKKDVKPTYDTTITNGDKDKFMTYEYIADNFKKR
jgi:hypothetical protein